MLGVWKALSRKKTSDVGPCFRNEPSAQGFLHRVFLQNTENRMRDGFLVAIKMLRYHVLPETSEWALPITILNIEGTPLADGPPHHPDQLAVPDMQPTSHGTIAAQSTDTRSGRAVALGPWPSHFSCTLHQHQSLDHDGCKRLS